MSLKGIVETIFNRDHDPCYWGHEITNKKYTDENGVEWSERSCERCDLVELKRGKKKIYKDYPIYMCTAPFGIIYGSISGTLRGTYGGMLSFNNGSISGSINSTLEEKYIVKYLDGDQLKTKTFDADDANVIIGQKDELVLTVELEESYETNGNLYHTDRPEYQNDRYWTIHIPELPKVDQLTQSFQKLNRRMEK